MDRPKQIELIRWTIEEYSGFSCSIEAAESYLDDFNSICASDETQADRQNEQTGYKCDYCQDTGYDSYPSDHTAYPTCPKCG